MIESITIEDVPTYGDTRTTIDGLSKFNFFFGSNGTGKTTISRLIADVENYPKCSVSWKGGNKLQPLVYNQDFVEQNFTQCQVIKGIFTLGKEQTDSHARISEEKHKLNNLEEKIKTLKSHRDGVGGKDGKRGELSKLENRFREKCWVKKQEYDEALKGGFEGFRNNSENFKQKVLQEQETNTAILLTLEELKRNAASVFSHAPIRAAEVPAVDTSKLLEYETNPILKNRVFGKGDVDIAAMILKLGNSDWVREGRAFHDANDHTCPFCQQSTTTAFAQSLEGYFDERFLLESQAIDDLATNYKNETARIQQQLVSIIASTPKFLDVETLKSKKALLDATISLNIQRLVKKKKEASQAVELDSLSNVCKEINELIDTSNTQGIAHNNMVANLAMERMKLVAQVWKFVINELNVDLQEFKIERDKLNKAISNMTAQIENAEGEKKQKLDEIRELEKKTTSIQPTIDGINILLSSFGFQGFKLANADTGTAYKLIRSDGSDAKSTLSEGEKTFVTFLYFYHLLKGSNSESGMTSDRIVVFDDPISSLDSDILFIVASLIKGLFDEVQSGRGHIKQIFVLTHNVYFHKEVTYNPKRQNVAMSDQRFWIIRKPGIVSKIDRYPTNPIKTYYELLWAEVRKPERSNLSIQNTLRRILENYFKILGGINLDNLCANFDGNEKHICKSLCAWIHDGSHYASDDLFVSINDSMVHSYLKVFREIFEKFNHGEHYKMMMGEAYMDPVIHAIEAPQSVTDPVEGKG